MQLFKLLVCLSFFLSPLVGKEKTLPKVTYVYTKNSEGSFSKTTWVIAEKNETLHIQGLSGNNSTQIIVALPFNTQSFSYQSKSQPHEYHIHREGSYLYAQRIDQESVFQKEFNIGSDLWIQEFDFSMRPFILSTANSLKFNIIHPIKLSLHQMIATKSDKIEHIDINGAVHDAIKVKIHLTGLKKMFWKAELWFEQNTGDLLKYVANEGPNTPISVITLLSKTAEK